MEKFIRTIVAILCIAALSSGCAGTGAQTPPVSLSPNSQENAQQAQTSAPAETPGESPRVIEPEELISKEEAAQLTGEAVQPGEKSEQPVVGQKICFYDSANEESRVFLQISISQNAFMSNDNQDTETIYNVTKENIIETGEQRQIEGLTGDYFFGTPGLHIFKDGYYLCIASGGTDDEKAQQALEQAGILAVKNLEKILSQ